MSRLQAIFDLWIYNIKKIRQQSARRRCYDNSENDIEGFKTNIPEGAFYVFPDVSYYFGKTIKGKTINSASDFSFFLLEEAHVATVTGEAFGDPNCIRISYAASQEQIIEAVKRIKKALN